MKWAKGISVTKDTDSILNWTLDLRVLGWLSPSDSISSHSIVDIIGVTVDSSSNDSDKIVAFINGGTIGEAASITYRISTTNGLQDDFTVSFEIVDK